MQEFLTQIGDHNAFLVGKNYPSYFRILLRAFMLKTKMQLITNNHHFVTFGINFCHILSHWPALRYTSALRTGTMFIALIL